MSILAPEKQRIVCLGLDTYQEKWTLGYGTRRSIANGQLEFLYLAISKYESQSRGQYRTW